MKTKTSKKIQKLAETKDSNQLSDLADRLESTNADLLAALERIAEAKPDRLDHSVDVAIIERAAKIARTAPLQRKRNTAENGGATYAVRDEGGPNPDRTEHDDFVLNVAHHCSGENMGKTPLEMKLDLRKAEIERLDTIADLLAALKGMIDNAQKDGDTRLAVQRGLAAVARAEKTE